MVFSINNIVNNDLVLDSQGVWKPADAKPFNYSEGVAAEKYLNKVFSTASDLSSNSFELKQWIKDWSSEYHLSRKRTQLLKGFAFNPDARVLEVGCGCGAITRYLGETFNSVVSVEGSIARARLARMRTSDLNSVTIINSPFQDLDFVDSFDLIVCVGVFEYSHLFISAEDPYDKVLKNFKEQLSPSGSVIIAIENQFGLKYFTSSTEDHIGTMFEGLEGYPTSPKGVRTFGRIELEDKLSKHFKSIKFYYPYPDYKMPTCILTEEFISSGYAGELISQIESRDYSGREKNLWDERLTALEINKNKALPFFANSFLSISSNSKKDNCIFNQQGILFSANRKPQYQTQTVINEGDEGLYVEKIPTGNFEVTQGSIIKLQETKSKWIKGDSLQTTLLKRCKNKKIKLEQMFEPAKQWIDELQNKTTKQETKKILDGRYLDHIWRNTYLSNDKCVFIDEEWVWNENIDFNVIVIRSIYWGLREMYDLKDISRVLCGDNVRKTITKIARSMGVNLLREDFSNFINLESVIANKVYGANLKRSKIILRIFLRSRRLQSTLLYIKTIRNKNGLRSLFKTIYK
jgi:SAM-dependent methyltransferase